ncbi:hypothetical protein [Microtetraspora malaysiensis]|uniref:hypothetical protein n=1 Tax=Microtetraspora malaysiensis TaxID=161358 RepID=UPI003D925B70
MRTTGETFPYATSLGTAFTSEARRRTLLHDARLEVPDEAMWTAGYASLVAELPWIAERSLPEAMAVARALVDPVLSGQVLSGTWDPVTLSWN